MNLRENILLKIAEICEDEGVNSRIFDPRAAPVRDSNTREKERIREGYVEFLERIPFDMAERFYGDGTGYPKETKERTEKIIRRCFEGGFRNYLRDVKERYPEEIWRLDKKGETK